MPDTGRPRAEFRVFGDDLIELVSAKASSIASAAPELRVMTPELYVLSAATDDAIVKVRNELLDVKIRIGETPEGYEIFEPQAKLPFPIPRSGLAEALSALGVSADLAQETFTVDDLTDLARRHSELLATRVEKIRHGFLVGSVICEYAQVTFDGTRTESAACESDDYGAIAAVVDALGLSAREIESYPMAAKRVLGFGRTAGAG